MCKKPKEEEPENDKPRSYYYDDAHGYEDFDPDSDEIEADENEDDESA